MAYRIKILNLLVGVVVVLRVSGAGAVVARVGVVTLVSF